LREKVVSSSGKRIKGNIFSKRTGFPRNIF